jgi:hypothetical protein
VVVELRGDDVVLARESWGCGDARIGLPMMGPKAATTALVGDEVRLQLEGNRGSTTTSEQRGSLHGGWLGQKMPGGGCPRQCRALPEREKKGGSGIWVEGSRIDKSSGGMGRRG